MNLLNDTFKISRKAIIQSLISVASLFVIHILLGGGILVPGLIIYCYWFLTGTIASLYGSLEGLFAAFLCSISFVLVQYLYSGEDYSFTVLQYVGQPIIWFFTALLFGEIRAQTNLTLAQTKDHLNTVIDTNTKLQAHLLEDQKQIKQLEDNLGQANKISEKIITSLLALLTLKPTQLLLNVENTIEEILGPKKFSIYGKGGAGFEVLVSHGWNKDEVFPLRITSSDPLFEQVVVHRETVAISDPRHVELLQNHGIFAAPLTDPDSGEVFGMLKIEDPGAHPIDADFYHIAEGLSKFIGQSYTLVKQYQDALKNSIFSKDSHIFSHTFYERIHPYLLFLAQKIEFSLVYFHIVLLPSSEKVFFKELRMLAEIIRRTLPEHTLYFLGKEPTNEVIALLPACSPRILETLEQNLTKALMESGELQSSKVFVTRKVEYIPDTVAT